MEISPPPFGRLGSRFLAAIVFAEPPFVGPLLMAAIKNGPAGTNDVLLGASVFARFNHLSERELKLQPMRPGGRADKK